VHTLRDTTHVHGTHMRADDDDAATHFPNPFLGEIHVAARPVRVTGRRPRTRDRENVTLAQDTIHERSKKAGVHTIRRASSSLVLLALNLTLPVSGLYLTQNTPGLYRTSLPGPRS
jgi:hypothetical protein